MELWIKSQKNAEVGIVPRLKKVDDIFLDYCGENDSYYISVNDGIEVGYYNSEKRALEVLGEIQSKIKSKQLIETKNTYSWSSDKLTECRTLAEANYVYEMPEE